MTRIEKIVIIALSVLSLSFLGHIIGSSKSQDAAPVVAQAAPAAPIVAPRPPQSATAQLAEQLRHQATVTFDKLQAYQCRFSQSRGAKNACEADFKEKEIDLISNINEAERRGRSDLLTEAAQILTKMESILDASVERVKTLEQWTCKQNNYIIEGVRGQYPYVLRNC